MYQKKQFSLAIFAAIGLCATIAIPSQAFAQDQQATEDEMAIEEVIVTGSIIKRPETATASPISILTEEELDIRGLNTISDAVQYLPANNAGSMSATWNSFGFASGATAVSLRGLTTSSTLTIFDGLRMAPYPLGDDGRRNFVDLNTIPDSIIDRIEVLKDGASSTYGADAVAGVVNVITKREITGVHFNGSYGISQEGGGDEVRGDITAGWGQLDVDGFNFYVNVEGQESDPIYARDRDYPFNTWDWSKYCNENGGCLDNGNINGLQSDGTIFGVSGNGSTVPMVRPYDPDGNAVGNWQLLNPQAGCGNEFGLIERNPSNAADVDLTGPVCEDNIYGRFTSVFPNQSRRGVNARITFRVSDSAEAYAMFNYYEVDTASENYVRQLATTTPPPNPRVSTNPLFLPVYVCPVGEICDANNGVLNPNNPFAADGQMARIAVRWRAPLGQRTNGKSYRYAAGIAGTFGNDDLWDYSVDAVSANVDLERTQVNYVNARRLLNVIHDGSYNWVNPEQNSQEIIDYIAPPKTTTSTSKVDQIQATLARPLFNLPGGSLVAAVGLAYREESVNTPSANPANTVDPYDRYLNMNAVATSGSRDVTSAFFEIDMPVVEMLDVNVSGRWDDYSSGQSNFSPKVGLVFQPLDSLRLRGSYSEGFRIPSFNEAYGLPTTGYITASIDATTPEGAAFLAAHGNNAYASQNYSIGLTSTGNPGLDPETSTSYTTGIVFEPSRDISISVDYWHIKVDDLVSNADYAPAIDLYYQNNGVVDLPGINVVPGNVDPDYPAALPLLGFIEYSYRNADSQVAEGIDLGASYFHDFGGIQFLSHLETSYLMKLAKTLDGQEESYEGTLSPCDVTSCSGAPDWRATWVNSVEWEKLTVALTANYTSSYDLASVDYGGEKGNCEANYGASVVPYNDGTPFLCTHGSYLDWDLSASYQISDKVQLYGNILNLFDEKPVFDPGAAYGLYGFNPAWESSGFRGRFFRVGIRLDF